MYARKILEYCKWSITSDSAKDSEYNAEKNMDRKGQADKSFRSK
jgi:hypothetical protein